MDVRDEVTELALAAGRGDRAALSQFIRRTQDDVWRFLARSASSQAADDLTQETYLRMLSALPRFEGRSSARSWLLSIARHVAIDRIRYDAARPRAHALDDLDTSRGTLHATDHTDVLSVQETLDTLDPDRRVALVLTAMLGFTYAEAAEICGCPVGTIRSRVARARADLMVELESRRDPAPA